MGKSPLIIIVNSLVKTNTEITKNYKALLANNIPVFSWICFTSIIIQLSSITISTFDRENQVLSPKVAQDIAEKYLEHVEI